MERTSGVLLGENEREREREQGIERQMRCELTRRLSLFLLSPSLAGYTQPHTTFVFSTAPGL